jgi:hypothetical protein
MLKLLSQPVVSLCTLAFALSSAAHCADAPLSASEAGRRGGEAAGAALVCYGLRITPEGANLRTRFAGKDLVEFDEQAARVMRAWEKVKRCESAGGPNECKVSQQWNCLMALKEVGPQGTAVPGLLEPK